MKYKNVLVLSMILLLSALTINVALLQFNYFEGVRSSLLSIPMQSAQGYDPVGVSLLVVCIIGLVLLPISLKEKRARFTLLALSIVIVTPALVNGVILG